MPRQKRPKVTPSSDSTLALSQLHRRLDSLEQDHQWLLKQIKKKQKELNNFVEQLRTIATEMFQHTGSYFQKALQLNDEIHQLFAEILNHKKMSKTNRKKVEKVYKNLQLNGLIKSQMSEEEEEDEEELDELFEEEEPQEITVEEQAVSPTPHGREIRQAFLKLAEIFHPDKAVDPETQQRHTEIMKEINRAYKEQDFARLLELEQQHMEGQLITESSEDDLTRMCQIKEKNNQILRKQYDNLLRELNLVKNTPEGAMVTDYRRAKREKVDPVKEMIAELEDQIEFIESIRDFVRDFRDNKVSIAEFIRGPESLQDNEEEILEELLEELLGGRVRIVKI